MRAFVFVSLFAVGLCGLLPGGYNYNGGSSFNHQGLVGPIFAGSNNVPSIGGGSAAPGIGGGLSAPGIGGGLSAPGIGGGLSAPGVSGPSGSYAQQPIGSPSIGSPSIAPQFPSGGFGGHSEAPAAHHEAPLISKQFYLHSAPEDHDNIGKTKHFVLGRPQKNYRVVFIKAPSDSSANVKLSAEYAPQEEKTVIYVLSQKEHELDVNDIATPAPTQPSKPEVFFIKYKTPEEAAHAQNEIQRQYDVLGGQSQTINAGTAPVSDVSGALTPASSNQQSNVGYLPPSH